MEVPVKITINLNTRDFERNLRHQVKQATDRTLAEHARQASAKRCGVHHQVPRVTRTHDGYTITACCEAFRAEIQREIGRQ